MSIKIINHSLLRKSLSLSTLHTSRETDLESCKWIQLKMKRNWWELTNTMLGLSLRLRSRHKTNHYSPAPAQTSLTLGLGLVPDRDLEWSIPEMWSTLYMRPPIINWPNTIHAMKLASYSSLGYSDIYWNSETSSFLLNFYTDNRNKLVDHES